MRKTYAIGALELKDGDVLVGDSISPTRYDDGLRVVTVNADDVYGVVMVILADGTEVDLNPSETVYIAR